MRSAKTFAGAETVISLLSLQIFGKRKLKYRPPRRRLQSGMDKTLRKYTSFDEMKADEYRYWQSRPAHERMDAVER